MAKVKYKVGDKVSFRFLGKYEEGIIEEITKDKISFSKYDIKYTINDGKYKYPTSYENIDSKLK